MILRGSSLVFPFVNAIACTIGRSERSLIATPDELTYAALTEDAEGVIYLGAGYWRAAPVWDEDYNLFGVKLINPDRTAADIATVEQGIAILCRFMYVP